MSDSDLFQIVDQLLARKVECVIIGGHAVNFYGYLRATEDIDLVFRRDSKSDASLFQTLQEFGAYWIGDELDPATGLELTHPVTLEYIRTQSLMMLGTSVGYLDLFDFLPGLEQEGLDDFFAAAIESSGRKFASRDWLKRLKSAANRPQDRLDLEHL